MVVLGGNVLPLTVGKEFLSLGAQTKATFQGADLWFF